MNALNPKEYLHRAPRWLKVSSSIIVIYVILLFIGSFFTRRYIESHSIEWVGRQIKMGSLWVNPLTGVLDIDEFRLLEKDADSAFVSFSRLSVNTTPWRYLFNSSVAVSSITLEDPFVNVVMGDSTFNFDDLIARFGKTDSTQVDAPAEKLELKIEDVQIVRGSLEFYSTTFGAGIGINDIWTDCPLFSSAEPAVPFKVRLKMKSGGSVESAGVFRQDSVSYWTRITMDSLSVSFLRPFLDKVMYITGIKGMINTDLTIAGKADGAPSEAKGWIRATHFELIDTVNKPIVSVAHMELNIDTVSAVKGDYRIRLAKVDKPLLRFDLTPYGNNLMRNTTVVDAKSNPDPGGESTEGAYVSFFKQLNHYMLELGKEYAINYYSIDSLIVRDGNIEFNDFTLTDPFHFLAERLNASAVKVSSQGDSIVANLHSSLNHSGVLNTHLVLHPKNVGDLYLYYSVDSLKITDFTPYSEYYVAHPFWDGVVFFKSTTTVTSKKLVSSNKLFVTDLEVGDKVTNRTAFDVPLRLAVSLLKDVNGNVDLKIPLKGNVDDPKFRVMPVVVKIMKDLIIKAVAAPYKLLARAFNANEEDIHDMKYGYLQTDIHPRQSKSLDLLARILKQKTDLAVKLVHFSNTDWEASQYAYFEARRQFYIAKHGRQVLDAADTVEIAHIMPLDTGLRSFLIRKVGIAHRAADTDELSLLFVGREQVNEMIRGKRSAREQSIVQYLSPQVTDSLRYSIIGATPEETRVYRDRPKFLFVFEAMPSRKKPQALTANP